MDQSHWGTATSGSLSLPPAREPAAALTHRWAEVETVPGQETAGRDGHHHCSFSASATQAKEEAGFCRDWAEQQPPCILVEKKRSQHKFPVRWMVVVNRLGPAYRAMCMLAKQQEFGGLDHLLRKALALPSDVLEHHARRSCLHQEETR